MANEHRSGLPLAHDRLQNKPEVQSLVFYGPEPYVETSNLNELQTAIRGRHDRLGRLIAKDGDRTEGAAAIVNQDTGEVLCTPGKIWLSGDEFPVGVATLYAVPMTGEIQIGVRRKTVWLTPDVDPSLRGIVPGADSEGENLAAQEIVTIAWAVEGDDGEGDFVPVYLLKDGVILDQTPPPALSPINAAIGQYDYQAHGNYIVQGNRVTWLGKNGTSHNFAIEEGVADIFGAKITRLAALRHREVEGFDIAEVAAESHIFAGTTPNTFTLSRPPLDSITSILVIQEKTVTVTRGTTANGQDLLPDSSVVAILEVKQGATTYVVNTSYVKTGDNVDWAPAGAEPAPGSTYTVKYQRRVAVAADSITSTTVTVSGGVAGSEVLIGYHWKLPRIDRLCLDATGRSVYVKGNSAASLDKALPPIPPATLLPLATISNDWYHDPIVENDGVYAFPYTAIDRMARQLNDHARLIQILRVNTTMDRKDPAAKKGTFADPLIDDFYRDAGVAQDAAVGNGVIQLAINPTFFPTNLVEPLTLPYTEEVIIAQEQMTLCVKINPYQNFTPLPAAMTITPPADHWVVGITEVSSVTLEFQRGVRWDNGPLVNSTEVTKVVAERSEQAQFLRQISLAFKIEGFGAGEILTTLTFDGINVKPAGTITADGNGEITGSFMIPANVTAGSKVVLAAGQGGSEAAAFFVGEGQINTKVMQRTTTVEHWIRAVVQPTEEHGSSDPQAQSFRPTEFRQVLGVDFRLCAIGNTSHPIIVQQVAVENGSPTEDVQAEAFVSMIGAATGWKSARYKFMALTPPSQLSAFVIKTDDADHSIGMARLGDFDAIAQKYVGAQPYSIGDNFEGSNGISWLVHPERDVTFRVVAAKFTATSSETSLGTFSLVGATDLLVRATVELPSADCKVFFKIKRPGGGEWILQPNQVLPLTEAVTEEVELFAELVGTEKLSPVLYAPVLFIAGKLKSSGTYVSRSLAMGTAVKLMAAYKAKLPAGATAVLEYDKNDGNWQTWTEIDSDPLAEAGWVERTHQVTGVTAIEGRLKLTLTGTPAARPIVGDLGASII